MIFSRNITAGLKRRKRAPLRHVRWDPLSTCGPPWLLGTRAFDDGTCEKRRRFGPLVDCHVAGIAYRDQKRIVRAVLGSESRETCELFFLIEMSELPLHGKFRGYESVDCLLTVNANNGAGKMMDQVIGFMID